MKNNNEYIKNIYRKIAIYKIKRTKIICSLAGIIFCMTIVLFCVEIDRHKAAEVNKDDNIKNNYNFSETARNFIITTDSMPTIFYHGNSYTFDGEIYRDKAIEKALIGEFLGNASGSMSVKEESEKVFASCVATGNIYSVNGYDKEFRICIYDKENPYIVFYDNFDENNLVTGNDLYSKLLLKNNYNTVLYQQHSDYMNQQNNYQECSELSQSDIDEFINALYRSSFVIMTTKEEIEKMPDYDSEGDKIAHLYFKMNDGTNVEITLYENGYVLYANMCKVYVYIEDEIFNKVFNAITIK